MPSEIGEDAQCAAGAAVVVLQGCRHHAPGDPLVGLEEWALHRPGVGGVEMREVGVHVCVPVRGEVVA